MSSQSEVYERHGTEVLAFLKRRLWNREEAEDLCQETFIRAFNAQDNLLDSSKLRSYLLRIANNLMLNHIRRHNVVTSVSNLGENADLEAYANPRQVSPAAAAEWSEFHQKLHEQLAQLPSGHRQAFELGVLQRQPYADIARELGWSVAKVKVTIFRARKQLMDGLREYRPESKSAVGGF
ncbi:MAG: RNA polymerase sigma factor [bacterium]